ncbi:MAG: hypothetical protein EPN20_14280 [Magnetospirillum sp.]|nr:MAG: hypothetical protein EPN20_14280 [Magnetospirillum sp.]
MTGKTRALGSDLTKVDAHVVQPEEYDEIPELTDEVFARADYIVGGKVVRRGRPPKDAPKVPVTPRLDADLVEKLRAGGQGWQSRVNEALRKAAGL